MDDFTPPDEGSYYNYNYYIKGDHAYTEDHVLVYKLFVYKIPRKANVGDVQAYFSNFGKLVHVNFIPEKKRFKCSSSPRVAFVLFRNSNAAARVLKTDRHYICSKRILVKACDSWHQPGAMTANNFQTNKTEGHGFRRGDDEISGINSSTSSANVNVNNSMAQQPVSDSILRLNDYCLENIIQRLCLRDQVRFARTCTRFRQIFEMSSKVLNRTLTLDRLDGMTLWEIRDYFDLAGNCIVRVEGELPEKYRERIVEFMGSHSRNIKQLNLETSDLRTKTLNKLVLALPNIVDLRLHYCSLVDPSILALRKLRNLKSLNLSYNFYLTGKHINTLSPTIETLSLNNCNALLGKNISNFCKSLINLKELDLEQSYCMSTAVYQAMITSCKNLETLKLGANHTEYERIAKLPKLKRLTIYTTNSHAEIRDALYQKLAEHKASQLEYFHIVGINCLDDRAAEKISRLTALRTLVCPNNEDLTENGLEYFCNLKHLEELILKDCRNVTNTALLRLAIACPKLKHIHIQGCELITDNLIFDLIRKMRVQIQNRTSERKQPVSFMVENTKINEYILNDPEYVAAADLVRIYFKSAPSDLLKYEDYYSENTFDVDSLDLGVDEVDLFPTEMDDDELFDNDFAFTDSDDDEDVWQMANDGMLQNFDSKRPFFLVLK